MNMAHINKFSSNDWVIDRLTILVRYDVRIDVIDRLLGLRVHWGGCTCIRRLAYDGSVLWTSGSTGGVLPVERRQDSSNGQGQKGRHGCQAQQQRIQHRCVGVACHDSRCKMLDQLELFIDLPSSLFVPRDITTRDSHPPFPRILHSVQHGVELGNSWEGSVTSNFPFITRFFAYRMKENELRGAAIRIKDWVSVFSNYLPPPSPDCIRCCKFVNRNRGL